MIQPDAPRRPNQAAVAAHGMVATAEPYATRVGLDVLKRGGNAVDAAIAVAFALAVTYPTAGNLGGGGFLMLRRRNGTVRAIDYREAAPARATRNVFLDANGNLIQGEGGSLVGYRAAGVPGTVAGMARALEEGSGDFSWSALLEPARALAGGGFLVSRSLARSLERSRGLLNGYADSRRIYLDGGRGWKEGERLRQPDLAETLLRLQKRGWREFYEGETARRIAADMRRHNGLMTEADLRTYAPKDRVPLVGAYRGYKVLSMPPPSSGGIALLQMLRMLEGFDVRTLGADSAKRHHLLIEAMRRAFADRAEYLGDPDFVRVPVARLLDRGYLDRRRAGIDPARASSSRSIGAGALASRESPDTTHFTIVDRWGTAVSNTYTLNGNYGSGATVAGTGILLNNEMDDFAAKVGVPNLFGLIQGERNAIAPLKRPLSSMTPTFVYDRDDRLFLTVGSPGGPTIINTVLQSIVNVVDHGMSVVDAVAAPRLHHQWMPDEVVYEPDGLSDAARAALEAMGHALAARPRYLGDAQAVLLDPATRARHGASDPRGSGITLGH